MPNYILLERIELNASAASVTFANIPQTGYTDLKVVLSARVDAGSGGYQTYVRFNGDTAANYNWRNLLGTGSAAVSQNTSGDTGMRITMSNSSGDTASTFGNSELYIPNYTGSTAKSVSADGVSENNATAATADLAAGLWTGTAAINSVNIFASGANFVANSTFSLYGLAAVGTTPAIAPKASGGNIIDYDGTYWIHTFLTSGTFTPQTGLTCDYLVVAGGGGGAASDSTNETGGGGGAGGYRTSIGGSPLSVTATAYSITVGGGGAGGTTASRAGSTGSNSIFSTITSSGGGFGGFVSAGSGGSGGGIPYQSGSGYSIGTGTAGQGNDGGYGGGASRTGGGGGGGGAGAVGATGNGGNGGAGLASSITGTSVTRAGGGAGGNSSGSGGTGGSGGGGNGGSSPTAGGVNLGGGGGGAKGVTNGAAGGSGVVIIRYLAA
jgi:hypothetical protein